MILQEYIKVVGLVEVAERIGERPGAQLGQRFGIGGSRNVLAVLPDRTGSVAITT